MRSSLAWALPFFVACSSGSTSSGAGGKAGTTTVTGASTVQGSGTTASSTNNVGSGPTTTGAGTGGGSPSGRGCPVGSPWVSFYGPGGSAVAQVAATFRIINIDADPDGGNFSDADLTALENSGQNRVISYMNVGSCENFRSYWSTDPPGHKSCVSSGALTTPYGGYPDEKWANLSNVAYQDLIVNYVAARLAALPIDGFFLDNMEVVEHGAGATEGPCDAACAQGGLDLVWQLRQKFPKMLIVMQNASSDITRLGQTHGVAYPSLLDGLSHEEVYSNGGDPTSLSEMKAWQAMGLVSGGHPFWLAVEEYVGACSAADKPAANAVYAMAMADGFNAYVTDASAMQTAPCFWSQL
jgi:cysteinyl-tRNA synthetase